MNIHQAKTEKSSIGKKLFERAAKWFEYQDKGEWITDMKNSIGIAVSIIATVTFSLATNPPGGVVQAGRGDMPFSTNDTFCLELNTTRREHICAGESILATSNKEDYLAFLVCNTICFMSSLSVLLLLVSGIPIRKTYLLWGLSIGMCVILTSFALTYMFAVYMVTPKVIWSSLLENVFGIVIVVWASFVVLLAAFFIVRLIVRGVHKVCNCIGCQ